MRKHTSISIAVNNKTVSDWLKWIKNYDSCACPRPLNKAESLALRDAIINPNKGYERVAEAFFYEMIKPLVCGLVYKIRKTYHTEVKPLDISTIIYRVFWEEGKFTRLRGYQGECSLFCWVARVASQVVYSDLEKTGLIKKSHQLTEKNTALRLKSFSDKEEIKAVIDIVTEPRWHDILNEVYVKRTSSEKIMKSFSTDEETFKKTTKIAESVLRSQLIATEFVLWRRSGSTVNLASKALGDASGKLDATSLYSDAFTTSITNDDSIRDEIIDVLRLKYPGLDPESMLEKFVIDQSQACGMTDNQRLVWIARYVNHESPVSVAARMGIRRTNVDNLYSRANIVLEKHLRRWWHMNS